LEEGRVSRGRHCDQNTAADRIRKLEVACDSCSCKADVSVVALSLSPLRLLLRSPTDWAD
jgi:hypothetical protein